MGFSVTLRVKDGQIIKSAVEGEPPDGQLEIHAHEDYHGRSIHVLQRGEDGRFLATASHTELVAGHDTERPLLGAE